MNIVLTQKDADFILKIIRLDLARVVESETDLDNKFAQLQKHHTENLKDISFANIIMQTATEMTNELKEQHMEIRKDLEHCIELLMCGSDNVD